MRRIQPQLLLIAGLALLFATVPVAPSAAQGDAHFFAETGHTIKGTFWQYWQAHGGLAQQGYPISEEIEEVNDLNGQSYTVQYFERAVFEQHPENKPPYDVLLTQLGTIAYKYKYERVTTPQQRVGVTNPRFFPETNHTLAGRFREYWDANGGLAQQGYPISDEFDEKSDLDGKTYRVQYFERAVFEYHPENKAPYDVLLTQLGRVQWTIKTALEAAAKLDSPPRMYGQGPAGEATWPPQPGAVTARYGTCGVQPLIYGVTAAPATPPVPPTCSRIMVLSTAIAPAAAGFDVTFAASWNDGAQVHRWRLHVEGNGQVRLLAEEGDDLPPFPM